MIPLSDDNPAHRRPLVTVALIVACCAVFLLEVAQGDDGMQRLIVSYGLIPAVLTGDAVLPPELARIPSALTLLTAMFLHGGWLHLAGNMLYLWIFGNNTEDRLGHLPFLAFYLGCGLAAAALHVLPDPGSEIPMVGASGAISGVLGAYMVLFPHARVLVLVPLGFMFLHRIRAVWMLAIWFGLQIVSAVLDPGGESGIAWWAHVGGFVAGALVAVPYRMADRRRARRRGPWG
ncbi:MAG: rhomboid family intramembrane serine protease [Geminicoccaceae bacterium]